MENPKFLKNLARLAGGASIVVTSCMPDQLYPPTPTAVPIGASATVESLVTERFTDQELQKLGMEIIGWRLPSRERVVDVFPEAMVASQFLLGRIHPQSFVPRLGIPVILEKNTPEPGFTMTMFPRDDDPRKSAITTASQTQYIYSWIGHARGLILVPSDIMASSARLPVVTTLTSRLIDHDAYSRLYLGQMGAKGIKFKVQSINLARVSLMEASLNLATSLERAELEQTHFSTLQYFIQHGSAIRNSVLMANWLEVEKIEGRRIPPTDWATKMNTTVEFAITSGLIKKQGSVWVWTAGQSPNINSMEFISKINELANQIAKISPDSKNV